MDAPRLQLTPDIALTVSRPKVTGSGQEAGIVLAFERGGAVDMIGIPEERWTEFLRLANAEVARHARLKYEPENRAA